MNVKTGLKAAKAVVTSKAGRQVLKARKHSPVILFTAGSVGAVTSTVLACKATLRLEDAVVDHNNKIVDIQAAAETGVTPLGRPYSDKDAKRDIAVVQVRKAVSVCKLYGPAILVGGLSIAALTGSHVILTKRQAGLMAAYAALDQGFRDYRGRVVERFGPEVDQELRFESEEREVVTDTENGPKVETVKTFNKDKVPSIYAEVFDHNIPAWQGDPGFNMTFLKGQQAYHNDMLRVRGHVFLNDVRRDLGFPDTKAGAMVGWVKDPKNPDVDNFISFGIDGPLNDGDRPYVRGRDGSILLDFNVQGIILDQI